MKREKRIMAVGGKSGRSRRGRSVFFSPPQSARCFPVAHYDALQEIEMLFGLATVKTQSEMETGPRGRLTQAHTYTQMRAHTPLRTLSRVVLCLKHST